jgi:hypothetical protein
VDGQVIYPSLIRCDEAAAGSIDHAIRLTAARKAGG